jgi:hypothetical protein
LLTFGRGALACRCAPPVFPNCELANAVLGEILTEETKGDCEGKSSWKFRVDAVYKQETGLNISPGSTITVTTNAFSSCRSFYSPGKYLIFPSQDSECSPTTGGIVLSTGDNTCGGTIQAPDDNALEQYRAACAPAPIGPPCVRRTCIGRCLRTVKGYELLRTCLKKCGVCK